MKLNRLEMLPELSASDVKKRGWRGVMQTLRAEGVVVITNHEEPEAVILPVREYKGLLEVVKQAESRVASELDALRLRFDERLAALRAPKAGVRLRSVMRGRARLGGKVKAGTGH